MPSSRQMGLRVLTETAEIDAIAEDWRALEAACSDRLAYFQTHDWCRGWIETFCRDGGPCPHVRTVWRGERLVALWPLMIVESAGIRRLETLGEPHTQYCNVLIADGEDGAGAVALLLEEGLGDGCDVAVLRPVPATSPLARYGRDLPPISGYSNESSMLRLSDYGNSEDYWAGLGKLQKRNRNRRRNQLARRLGELSFSMVWPGDPRFSRLVETAVAMKRRWLTETNRLSAGFSMNGYERFLNGLCGDPTALSGACVSVLRAGERIVAVEIGFIHHRHYYAYIGGFDWELRDLSPGKVQMEMTVGWLIDHGIATYDLLPNPADYKASWSNHSVAVTGYAVPLTWKGRFYAASWLPTLRPALKRLWSRVPAAMQAASGFGRGALCLLLYV